MYFQVGNFNLAFYDSNVQNAMYVCNLVQGIGYIILAGPLPLPLPMYPRGDGEV
jgi:hypothetical protein